MSRSPPASFFSQQWLIRHRRSLATLLASIVDLSGVLSGPTETVAVSRSDGATTRGLSASEQVKRSIAALGYVHLYEGQLSNIMKLALSTVSPQDAALAKKELERQAVVKKLAALELHHNNVVHSLRERSVQREHDTFEYYQREMHELKNAFVAEFVKSVEALVKLGMANPHISIPGNVRTSSSDQMEGVAGLQQLPPRPPHQTGRDRSRSRERFCGRSA